MKVCLSIEGKSVKVIEATKRSSGIFIHKASLIPLEGLDSFLSSTRHRNFIVSVDFQELHPEILNLPPVKGTDLKKVIASELKRLYPDYYYIYHDLGERIIENRRTRSVAILRTRRSQVDQLIEQFLHHGKNIETLFSAPSCIASFLDTSGRSVLCLFETDENNIFLLKDNIVYFTRRLARFEKGLSALDIQGIEFSITHCVQNLRIPPQDVVLVGDFKDVPDSIGGIKVTVLNPVEGLKGIHYNGEDLHEYLIPLGSLNVHPSRSFLSKEYMSFKLWKNLLRMNTGIFVALFIVFSILSLNTLYEISSLRSEALALLTKHRAFNIFINSYNKTVEEAKSLLPYAEFLRNGQGVFMYEVLRELSGVSFKNIQLKNIELSRSETVGGKSNSYSPVRLKLSGSIISERHKDRLLSFQALVSALSTMSQRGGRDVRAEILNKRLSIPDGQFDIELSIVRKGK